MENPQPSEHAPVKLSDLSDDLLVRIFGQLGGPDCGAAKRLKLRWVGTAGFVCCAVAPRRLACITVHGSQLGTSAKLAQAP